MANRKVQLDLGINGAFITRRWADPDNWMRLTRDLGYRCHEFCGDVIDPFFSGDHQFQFEQAKATHDAAVRYGVEISDIYTGVATHRFHGLSHPDERARLRMQEWILDCAEIAQTMGTTRIGGHWDAIPVEDLDDGPRYEAAIQRICKEFRVLSRLVAEKGIGAIYNEQMYIPSEIPWTLAQAERFLIDVNRDRDGAPVYLTVDVGHQAGMHYGLNGDDLSYVKWLERFAAFSEIIHLQQTSPDHSAHWPFMEPYNERGHIRMEVVLEAIEKSHRQVSANPVAEVLEPVSRSVLVLEAIPGSTKTESDLLDELKQSNEYLSKYVPFEGLALSIE